jgi:hypothetical protein
MSRTGCTIARTSPDNKPCPFWTRCPGVPREVPKRPVTDADGHKADRTSHSCHRYTGLYRPFAMETQLVTLVSEQNEGLLRTFLSSSRQGMRAQRSYSVPTPRTERASSSPWSTCPTGRSRGFPTKRRGCRAPAISANEEDSA